MEALANTTWVEKEIKYIQTGKNFKNPHTHTHTQSKRLQEDCKIPQCANVSHYYMYQIWERGIQLKIQYHLH